MARKSQKFDVIVVGRGITALSTAFHLKKSGVGSIALVGPERTHSNCLSAASSFVCEATIDNITRMSHQYGSSTAASFLALAQAGYSGVKLAAQTFTLPWHEDEVIRLATSSHEATEMQQAVSVLRGLGFAAESNKPADNEFGSAVVSSQRDGLRSACSDVPRLLVALEKASQATVFAESALALTISTDAVKTSTQGYELESELVVVAAHLSSGDLLPNLRTSLVSFADQLVRFRCTEGEKSLKPGRLHVLNHGHHTLWKDCEGRICMTGARFLRPMAGFEAKSAEATKAVTSYLTKHAGEWFRLENMTEVESFGLLECKPCDELPIIGPMFGESRVLVGTGFSGSGIALGFAAGQGLAEFVKTGSSKVIDPMFFPARLRSLS